MASRGLEGFTFGRLQGGLRGLEGSFKEASRGLEGFTFGRLQGDLKGLQGGFKEA